MSTHKTESENSQPLPFLKMIFQTSHPLPSWFSPVTISLLAFIVYVNMLSNGFVWDDNSSIQTSSYFQKIQYIPKMFTDAMDQIYRPLTYSTFIIVYSLFKDSTFFFHLVSLAFHIGVGILIFSIFKRFFSERLALVLSLLFVLHPINVEAVSWISALSEITYVFYGLLSFLFTLRYLKNKNQVINLVLTSVFIFLSYLSKESAFIISGVIILYVFLYEKKKLLLVSLAQIIPLVTYILLRFMIAKSSIGELYDDSIVPIQTLSLGERLLHIPSILVFYIQTFFFPLSLRTHQYWTIQSISSIVLPLIEVSLIVGILIVIGVWLKKKKSEYLPHWIFFCGWVTCWSLFHIQLFPLTMTVAERWFYFGGIGMLGLIGIAVIEIQKKKKLPLSAIIPIVFTLIIFFSGLTMVRNTHWKDNFTLFSADYRSEENNASLENSLGSELYNRDQYEEAYPYIKRSTELSPKGWKNWTNLGMYYQKKGMHDEAIDAYKKAITNHKEYIPAYRKLAYLFLMLNRVDEAEPVITEALKQSPNNAALLRIYALVLYSQNNNDAAIETMTKAVAYDPSEENRSLLESIKKGEPIEIN